jgi:type IV pilus assembly protein PilA
MKKPTQLTIKSAFSLVELLVVIAVIAIIAAIAIPNIAGITGAANASKTLRNAQNLASTYNAFVASSATPPTITAGGPSSAGVTAAITTMTNGTNTVSGGVTNFFQVSGLTGPEATAAATKLSVTNNSLVYVP